MKTFIGIIIGIFIAFYLGLVATAWLTNDKHPYACFGILRVTNNGKCYQCIGAQVSLPEATREAKDKECYKK